MCLAAAVINHGLDAAHRPVLVSGNRLLVQRTSVIRNLHLSQLCFFLFSLSVPLARSASLSVLRHMCQDFDRWISLTEKAYSGKLVCKWGSSYPGTTDEVVRHNVPKVIGLQLTNFTNKQFTRENQPLYDIICIEKQL